MSRQYQASLFNTVFSFFERLTLAGFFMVALLAVLYVVGSLQNFTAETQSSLLHVLRTSSAVGVVTAVLVLMGAIAGAIAERRLRYLLHAVLVLPLAALMASVAAGSAAIAALQQGVL